MIETNNVPEELVRCEAEVWESGMNPVVFSASKLSRKLFGRTWVPLPQDNFMDLLHKLQRIGINNFEPHYFPKWQFGPKSKYPGKGIPPSSKYWQMQICRQERFWASGTPTYEDFILPGSWVAVDTIPRMVQMGSVAVFYPNDPIGHVLAGIERSQRNFHEPPTIALYRGKESYDSLLSQISPSTRTCLRRELIQHYAIPELAEFLEIPASAIRLPRSIEYNLMWNLGYSSVFEGRHIAEWCHDGVLTDGGLGRGQLPIVELGDGFTSEFVKYDYDSPSYRTGFRFIIESQGLKK